MKPKAAPDGQRHVPQVRSAEAKLPQPPAPPHVYRTIAGHGGAGVESAEQAHDTVLHQLLHAAGARLHVLVNTLHSSVAELHGV